MFVKKKYLVQVMKGHWVGLLGWTYDSKPNPYGNIMVYSLKGVNPYRVCVDEKEVVYLSKK